MKAFNQLLSIAKRKTHFDNQHARIDEYRRYLTAIKEEVDEVVEELPKNRQCYLEDELGDILWDYLNVLTSLEKEIGLDTETVLKRACQKYEQRMSGLEEGKKWADIKEKQKKALATEHALTQK